jgi:hypothetical protein
MENCQQNKNKANAISRVVSEINRLKENRFTFVQLDCKMALYISKIPLVCN